MKNLIILAILILILIPLDMYIGGKTVTIPEEPAESAPLESEPENIPTPTPTKIIYRGPTPTPIPWGETFKINEHISATYFAADDHMSTADELFEAMNIYRSAHNLPTLSRNDTLCSIAQDRANKQVEMGQLSHDGFSEAAQSQQEFSYMSEVLFGGKHPVSGIHIVEWGWDRSLTGHKEAISNPKWTHGCGGVAGYYAVFIFAQR